MKSYEITSYGIKRKLTPKQRVKLLRRALRITKKAVEGMKK